MNAEDKARIDSLVGTCPDFPKKGILFYDVLPIFYQPEHAKFLLDTMTKHIRETVAPKTPNKKIDVIVGLEARGFILGPTIALNLGAAFVPVRKQGKLPGETLSASYVKEYGEDIFEIQKGAIKEGQTVVVVDDLIATGGSASAAGSLVKQSGGTVSEYLFVVELLFLKGCEKLDAPSTSILQKDE